MKNYDDTELRNRVSVVESEAHTHSNKTILDQVTQQVINNVHNHTNKTVLDQTTANYTIEEKEKLASLEPCEDFVGATPTENGEHGLVPAPLAGQESYYLRGDGTWAAIENLLKHIVIYCSDDVSDEIQLGTPVDAPVAANKTLSSVKENDLTILEV